MTEVPPRAQRSRFLPVAGVTKLLLLDLLLMRFTLAEGGLLLLDAGAFLVDVLTFPFLGLVLAAACSTRSWLSCFAFFAGGSKGASAASSVASISCLDFSFPTSFKGVWINSAVILFISVIPRSAITASSRTRWLPPKNCSQFISRSATGSRRSSMSYRFSISFTRRSPFVRSCSIRLFTSRSKSLRKALSFLPRAAAAAFLRAGAMTDEEWRDSPSPAPARAAFNRRPTRPCRPIRAPRAAAQPIGTRRGVMTRGAATGPCPRAPWRRWRERSGRCAAALPRGERGAFIPAPAPARFGAPGAGPGLRGVFGDK